MPSGIAYSYIRMRWRFERSWLARSRSFHPFAAGKIRVPAFGGDSSSRLPKDAAISYQGSRSRSQRQRLIPFEQGRPDGTRIATIKVICLFLT
jgi:hypothetical protein